MLPGCRRKYGEKSEYRNQPRRQASHIASQVMYGRPACNGYAAGIAGRLFREVRNDVAAGTQMKRRRLFLSAAF